MTDLRRGILNTASAANTDAGGTLTAEDFRRTVDALIRQDDEERAARAERARRLPPPNDHPLNALARQLVICGIPVHPAHAEILDAAIRG